MSQAPFCLIKISDIYRTKKKYLSSPRRDASFMLVKANTVGTATYKINRVSKYILRVSSILAHKDILPCRQEQQKNNLNNYIKDSRYQNTILMQITKWENSIGCTTAVNSPFTHCGSLRLLCTLLAKQKAALIRTDSCELPYWGLKKK